MDKSIKAREEYYNNIIPTAWLTAYRRTFSDIPFSSEIFTELDKLLKSHKFPITEDMKASQLSPQMEARYKLINHLLKYQKGTQILEIASGFSSRGLEFCKNPKIIYVEFDLPLVIEEKQRIINIINKNKDISNLHLVKGNALDINSLLQVEKYFDKRKSLIIINEGLLRYLNFDEKTSIAKNVHHLLTEYSGVWITPDITLKNVMYNENKNVKEHNKLIQQMTKINTDKNRFDTEKQAENFFRNLGFIIERHSYMEVKKQLHSPKILKIPEDIVQEMISFPIAYVMKIKE